MAACCFADECPPSAHPLALLPGMPCRDKRVVKEPETEQDIWWSRGSPNYEMDEKCAATPHPRCMAMAMHGLQWIAGAPWSCRTFILNRERAVDYLNTLDRIYVFDGFAGCRQLNPERMQPCRSTSVGGLQDGSQSLA